MNPVIEAALIAAGVGGLGIVSTTVVSVVSAIGNRKANREILKAAADNLDKTLDAARDERLWDAKSAAYTDAIELLRHMNRVRREKTRPIRWDEQTEKQIQDWLTSIKVPEWAKNEAFLVAFASPHVLNAVEANAEANSEADMLWDSYKFLASAARETAQAGRLPGPDGDGVIEARNAALAAVEAAEGSARKLVDAIRADLHNKPSESSRSGLPALPSPARRELISPGEAQE